MLIKYFPTQRRDEAKKEKNLNYGRLFFAIMKRN